MAMTRVQATSVVVSGFTTTLAVVFASPPTVGNAIILVFLKNALGATTSVVDNKGNTYALAKTQTCSGTGTALDIWLCGSVTTTGASFTVTATGPSANRTGLALEVSPALAVDQTVGTDSSGTTYTTGTTAALAGSDAFLVAAIATAASTLTVGVVSPVWTEETDQSAAALRGEVDSRAITSATGTTQSATWSGGGAVFFGAALVAFKAAAAAGPPPTTQVMLLLV